MFWNIENFGGGGGFKSDYLPLTGFIEKVCSLLQVDVLFLQEVKQAATAVGGPLEMLQKALCRYGPPRNNWYYDWIKGGLAGAAPFTAAAQTRWSVNHYEGYAVFWNQNIAKHKPTSAPPAPGAGQANNSQSAGARYFQRVMGTMQWGHGVPAGGLTVPLDPGAYVLPAGTIMPGAGAPLGDTPVDSGTVIPFGTQIGRAGIRLNSRAPALDPLPVVVPGNYTVEASLTLPRAGSVVVPEHILSLAIEGRDTTNARPGPAMMGRITNVPNYVAPPGGQWQDVYFPRGKLDPAMLLGARRPAFVQLDVNLANVAGAPPAGMRIVPVIVYHAPAAAANVALQRASYVRPLYEVWEGGQWETSIHAVLGGDFNAHPLDTAYVANAFTGAFGVGGGTDGGANCQIGVGNQLQPGQQAAQVAGNNTNCALNRIGWQGRRRITDLINQQATAAYRTEAIDNVLHRGFPAPGAQGAPNVQVVDLVCSMLGPAAGGLNIPLANVTSFLNVDSFSGHWNAAWQLPPGPAGLPNLQRAGIQNLNDLLFDMTVGIGTLVNPFPARRAAELVRWCISDHHPVLFGFVM